MEITSGKIKLLRERTGAGVLDCKRALEETGGDLEKAAELLRQRGLAAAAKVAGREAREGIVEAYVHHNGDLGVLLELNCETDFVARTEDFRTLAHDLALQVAAIAPRYIAPEDVPAEVIEERRRAGDELEDFYRQVCLLNQPFIKDQGLSVADRIRESVAKLGENIVVRRFVRFELGGG
ncbi:MAG: translation elongation factor Ts [Chloroflexi bacterium]|nr:translation elongation factor Ts [Chloroflexota bacterium]